MPVTITADDIQTVRRNLTDDELRLIVAWRRWYPMIETSPVPQMQIFAELNRKKVTEIRVQPRMGSIIASN